MILELITDLLLLVLSFLAPHECVPLRFVCKRLSVIPLLKESAYKGRKPFIQAINWAERNGHTFLFEWLHKNARFLFSRNDIFCLLCGCILADTIKHSITGEWKWGPPPCSLPGAILHVCYKCEEKQCRSLLRGIISIKKYDTIRMLGYTYKITSSVGESDFDLADLIEEITYGIVKS